MTKKLTNYVEAEKVTLLIATSGLRTKDQAGFTKVLGAEGRCLYVARTKRVGRVDVSGFESTEITTIESIPEPAIKNLGGEAFGNVHQQVDFTFPEEVILATISHLLDLLKTLPPRERVKRSALPHVRGPRKMHSIGKGESEIVFTQGGVDQTPDERKAARKELIRLVARQKGVAVHPSIDALPDLPAHLFLKD